MAYERITAPQADVYHYTKKENLNSILLDDKIRKYRDKGYWFCASLKDSLCLMELTVMNEGGLYIGVNGLPIQYPKFCSDDINDKKVLAEEFSNLKLGYRGDLKFQQNSEIFEMSEALQMRVIDAHTMQGFCY